MSFATSKDAPGTARSGCILIGGQTATGKSELAIEVAERVGGEIVSFDSMQVYQGMDIGTAKPSTSERARVAHHLIDLVPVSQPFDVSMFLDRARTVVQSICERGRIPVLAGGTGLYFKGFIQGLVSTPVSDPALRARLEATPLEPLVEELLGLDPAAARSVDVRNHRRVIRAVELVRLTGRSLSEQRTQWAREEPNAVTPNAFLISRDREDLRQRIHGRVDEMFRRGLVEETAVLLSRGLAGNRTALQALGYRQVAEYLQGVRSLEETVVLVKNRTWQFARRQRTFFTGQLAFEPFHVAPGESAGDAATRLMARIKLAG